MTATIPARLRILITGGCGKIGSYFARFAQERYAIRAIDRTAWDARRLGELRGETLTGDLSDPAVCRAACAGIDVVIHLAADADPDADFIGSLLDNNIMATYHMFEAARQNHCSRFIYASSAHAVAAYPPDVQINEDMPVQPTTFYGVSKCFGEALAAHYGVNLGLPSIAIRIGAYLFPEEARSMPENEVDAYLHPDDFNHLLIQCIETPGIRFEIAHAISDNRYKRMDLTHTRRVFGYNPQADGFALRASGGMG